MANNQNYEKDSDIVRFYYYWLYQYCTRNFYRAYEHDLERLAYLSQDSERNDAKCNHNHSEITSSSCHDPKGSPVHQTPNDPKDFALYDLRDPLDIFWDVCNNIKNRYFLSLFNKHKISRFSKSIIFLEENTERYELKMVPSETILLQIAQRGNIEHGLTIENKIRGIKVIGTAGAYIDNYKHINGKIIAEIDISLPAETIKKQIEAIKQKEFECFPKSMDVFTEDNDDDFAAQLFFISENKEAKFKPDDIPRAIGLYFWDMINSGFVKDVPTLLKLINRDEVKGYEYISVSSNDTIYDEFPPDDEPTPYEESTPIENVKRGINYAYIPDNVVWGKLGHSASDERVFRRIYSRTRECIDKCEVLSFKK